MKLVIALCLALHGLPAQAAEFSISGLKIGDTVCDKNSLGVCPVWDNGTQPECASIFNHAGGEVFVTYYFKENIFTGATILFDSKKFSKFVSYYEKEFGAEPVISKEKKDFDGEMMNNKIAVWKINEMEFIVEKYKSYKRGFAYMKSSAANSPFID